MKKKTSEFLIAIPFVIIVIVFLVIVFKPVIGKLFGNQQLFDTTYTFDHAIVSLPDGTVVKGEVDSWNDYEDGDQIQVKIDGVVYLVHSSNIALMNE